MKTRSFILFFVLFGIGFLTVVSQYSCNKKTDTVIIPDSTYSEKLVAALRVVIADNNVPGATVYIQNSEGEVCNAGLGLADVENTIAMRADTKVRVASISKTFLATVVLQLWEENKLDIDHLMSQYLPDSIVGMFPYGNDVTLRQLLNMTSGIYDFEDMEFIYMLLDDPLYPWTPYELLYHAVHSSSSQHEEPGIEFHYTNTNYILLAMIVEEVTNISMEQNIRNRVLTPLNLNNTYCGSENIPQENYAKGYQQLDETNIFIASDQTLSLNFEWAHGQIVSTVQDLNVFFNALMDCELYAEKATLNAMNAFTPLSDYGYGLGLDNLKILNSVGHNGSTVGFISFAYINPDDNSAIIFSCNSGNMEIMNAMLKEIIKFM